MGGRQDLPTADIGTLSLAASGLAYSWFEGGNDALLHGAAAALIGWMPFGGLFNYSGTKGIDLRFPGQVFQAETGLHYNWNRHYDPTTGRYTQPDPLELVDAPSRFAYVSGDPLQKADPTGLAVNFSPIPSNSPSGLGVPKSMDDVTCTAQTIPVFPSVITKNYGVSFGQCMIQCQAGMPFDGRKW